MKTKIVSKKNGSGKIKPALSDEEKLWRQEMTDLRRTSIRLWQETQLLESFHCLDLKGEIDFYEEKNRFEIQVIKIALFQTGGSQTRAAKLLGTTLSSLNNKIKRYKIAVNQTFNKIGSAS
jgi:transcriptional regulator with GAF, ATPase, and Fis domain